MCFIVRMLVALAIMSCPSQKSGRDLIKAIKANDFETAKKIATEKNVNATDEMNATPAMWAAYVGNLEVLKLLLEKGADVKKHGIIGINPEKVPDEPKVYTNVLTAAAGEGHLDVVKYLIEKVGVPPDLKGDCLNFIYLLPDQVIKIKGLFNYIKKAQGRVFEYFRQHEYYKMFLASSEEARPYYFCLIINDLIMQKDLVNEVSDNYAFRKIVENRKEVDKEFKSFVRPLKDYSFIKEKNSGTSLIPASFYNHEDVVHYLITKGADVNIKDCNDMSPIMAAAIGQNLNIVELLLENNADGNVKIKYYDGDNKISVLDHLFYGECDNWKSEKFKSSLRKILPLLWNKGSYIKDSSIPLYKTCTCKDEGLVKMMMENGADYSRIEYKGRTLEDICKKNGIEIKDEWLKKKAKYRK